MRSKGLLVCTCLLFTLFILISCGKSSDVGASSEPVTSNKPDEASTEQNTEQTNKQDNVMSTLPSDIDTESSPLIFITSNGETYAPFENIIWSEERTEEGGISVDYLSLIDTLPTVAHKLSTVVYSDDFTVDFGENVSFQRLTIFNDSFELIDKDASLSDLEELTEGTYYIIIAVKKKGRFINEGNEHAASGYECAFSLVVK